MLTVRASVLKQLDQSAIRRAASVLVGGIVRTRDGPAEF